MDLYLRKSDQGQLGPEIYRVILKDDDGDEVEIGSISVQHSAGAEGQCRDGLSLDMGVAPPMFDGTYV